MSNNSITELIKNYLEQNKTKSAIMLSAPWGTGKSYYINNELLPNLKKDKKKKYDCIIISLYGTTSLYEISKSLFMESKFAFLAKDSKKAAPVKFIAKTVLKSLANLHGIDLSKTPEEMQELYASVNLSGKLIIFEDLERSGIDIIEILGYVNNLVEEDGVKILLVANEDELIKHKPSVETTTEQDNSGKPSDETSSQKEEEYTETTKKYLEQKEKTVSDTIKFTSDTKSAIESIFKSFKDKTLDSLLLRDKKENTAIIADILHIMEIKNRWNLRSVIFGCQKTVDIYARIKNDIKNDGFFKLILCGTIAFSLKLKNDDSITWDEQDSVASTKLGTNDYPLLYATYLYIKEHVINNEEFSKAYRRYCQTIETEKANECLQVIYGFSVEPQQEVETGLSELIANLENEKIPYSEFEKLASYLVAIRHIIGCDKIIERCHDLMIQRLKKAEIEDEKDLSSIFYCKLKTKEELEEFREWKEEMQNVLKAKERNHLAFDYTPKSIESFYNQTFTDSSKYLKKRCFAKLFDIDKLLSFLKEASPLEICRLRDCFANVYHFSNLGEFFSEDKEALLQIKNKADSLICAENPEIKDGIVRYQIGIFSEELNSYIEKM